MFRPLPIFIGARYTRAKRRNHFISFISMTSMIGLSLGVLAMIVVLSVMNGFQREMSSRILGLVPHAAILGVQPLDDWHKVADAAMKNPAVMAVAPITEMEGMLSYKGAMQPIQVGGIDPAEEGKVSIVGQHIVQGRLQGLQPGEFGVVIGELTARRFRLNTGDKLTLIVPEISKEPGGITPRMQRLTVAFGMVMFGLFSLVLARYRIIPDIDAHARRVTQGVLQTAHHVARPACAGARAPAAARWPAVTLPGSAAASG